jgi:hypothetical protein
MKRASAGLICAGGITQSFVARLPSVLAAVGPVKSVSFRVARRLANSLRVGHAVEDSFALRDCESIWIAVPEAMLDGTIAELRHLPRKQIVVCDSRRDSHSLKMNGARVATLNAVDTGERILAAEGHPDVLRLLRRVSTREHRKLIELRASSKPLFFAGINLASQLILPPFSAAVESLRAAGFPRAEATRTAEALGSRALRAYSKAGRKAWSPGAAPVLQEALEQDLNVIRSAEPGIAEVYAAAIAQALRYF